MDVIPAAPRGFTTYDNPVFGTTTHDNPLFEPNTPPARNRKRAREPDSPFVVSAGTAFTVGTAPRKP